MTQERNHKLDNVKALLIFLVVVGHLADFYVKVSTNMQFLYFFIYIFHMPLFIFLSGLFIKSTINGKRFRIERVISFFILYLALKVIFYILFKYGFSNPDVEFSTFSKSETAWYLLAMCSWISLTYILKQVKPKLLLPLSFLAGVLIGYDSFVGDYLSLSRTIVFFPFFLLGYYIDRVQLTKFLSLKKLRIISFIVIIATFFIVYLNIDDVYQFRGFFTGKNSYEKLDQSVYGGLYRSIFYAISLLISFAVLFIVPGTKNIFTVIGERTLQVFILHLPLLYILDHFNIEDLLANITQFHWLKLYILLSIPITLLLAIRPLEWPFKKIMGLKYNSILKQ